MATQYPVGNPSVDFKQASLNASDFNPIRITEGIQDNYSAINNATMTLTHGHQISVVQNFVNETFLGRNAHPVLSGFITNLKADDIKTNTIFASGVIESGTEVKAPIGTFTTRVDTPILNSTTINNSGVLMTNSLVVNTSANIGNTLDVGGDTNLSGTLDVTGNTNLSGTLDVRGQVDFNDDLNVTLDLDVNGATTTDGITNDGLVKTTTLEVTNTSITHGITNSGIITSTLKISSNNEVEAPIGDFDSIETGGITSSGNIVAPKFTAKSGTIELEHTHVGITHSTTSSESNLDISSNKGINITATGINKINMNSDVEIVDRSLDISTSSIYTPDLYFGHGYMLSSLNFDEKSQYGAKGIDVHGKLSMNGYTMISRLNVWGTGTNAPFKYSVARSDGTYKQSAEIICDPYDKKTYLSLLDTPGNLCTLKPDGLYLKANPTYTTDVIISSNVDLNLNSDNKVELAGKEIRLTAGAYATSSELISMLAGKIMLDARTEMYFKYPAGATYISAEGYLFKGRVVNNYNGSNYSAYIFTTDLT